MNNIGSNSRTDETTPRNEQHAADAQSILKRRILSTARWSCPRRYAIALLLCTLFFIQESRHVNESYTKVPTEAKRNSSKKFGHFGDWMYAWPVVFPSEHLFIGDFIRGENFHPGIHILEFLLIFTALVGALVIYKVSCRKFILAAVTTSSILHMLTPAALYHHSVYFFLIVIIGHDFISIPTGIAALSIWKDWAPPEERMRLVTISLCGMILSGLGSILEILLSAYVGENLNYFLGTAGIILVWLWYNITADTPKNDPLISEKKSLNIESKIPSNIQENIKLKAIPWMSILKCKQIYILIAVFFKLAFSVETIQAVGVMNQLHVNPLDFNQLTLIIALCVLAATVIGASVTMDFLVNRYKTYNLKIRKYFICGGFLLQCVLMVAAVMATSELIAKIFFILAFIAFAFSVPGCLTYPLDLSPRYAPLTAGIALTFFSIGIIIFHYVLQYSCKTFWDVKMRFYLIDGTITLATSIIFGIWGDVGEQQWSQVSSSRHSSHNYRSDRKLHDDEDTNHVKSHV